MKKYTYLFLILILSSCSFSRYTKCFTYKSNKPSVCIRDNTYKILKSEGKTDINIIGVSKKYYGNLVDKKEYWNTRRLEGDGDESWQKHQYFLDKINNGCYQEGIKNFYYENREKNKKLNKECIIEWKEAEKQQNENYKGEYRKKKQEEKMMEENVKKINDCRKKTNNEYDFYTCMNDGEGLQIYCDTILGNSTCQLKKTIKNIKNQCMQTNVYKHCMQKNCENLARSTGYNYYDCVND